MGAPGGGVRGRSREQDRVGSGAAVWHGGLAHPVPGGPVEGHGHPRRGVPEVGVHMPHTSCRYGPARVAGSGSRDLPVLVAADDARSLDAMVGQGAELGQGW